MQYHQENLNLAKDIKKRCISAQDTRATETYTPKADSSKFRQKIAILQFFNQDKETRKLSAKAFLTDKSAQKKNRLQKKSKSKKFLNDQKLALQQQRLSLIKKEHEQSMAQLSEKLRKPTRTPSGSKSESFIRWREKSKEKIQQLRIEEEQKTFLDLDLFNEKSRHSEMIKQRELEKVTESASKFNAKVNKVYEKKVNAVEDVDSQYMELIKKNKSISNRKLRLHSDLQRRLEWRKFRTTEKKLRVEMNLNEKSLESEKKEKNLESKHMKSVKNLQEVKKKLEELIESKQEKCRSKAERSFDKLVTQRKMQFDSKHEIIKKHMKIDHRLKIKKHTRDYCNEQLRSKILQESMDRVKVKHLKVKISKSKDPLDISSILNKF